MEGDVTKFRRKIGICRFFLILLCITVVALVIALIVVASKSKAETSESEAQAGFCKSGAHNINLEPPNPLPPFHDLTTEEVKSIKDYLYGREELNLVNSSDIRCNASYIFTMELKIPNKEATLNFLDNQQDQPDREAKVVIFRGDNQPQPDVKEYIVGPLPSPTYMKDYRTAPFHFRPFTLPELLDAGNMVHHEVQTVAGQLLQESYGGQIENCGDKCLSFFQLQNSESSSTSGHMDKRRTWFWLYQIVEFFSLHPVGFHVLVDLTGTTKAGYKIVKVSYGEASFDTLQDLMAAYESNAITKIRIPFPVNDEKLFSSLHMRGDPFPAEPASKPIQFEPHGKRYSISGRHIEYLGWEMDVRLSIVSGPQLFDIRYEGERIVYELSLQEAAAYYSAHNPAHRSSDFADSFFLIGNRVRTLIAGVDCPRHATFLSSHVVTEDREAPFKIDRAFCVFEHNTGIPLRRHLSRNNDEGKFFEGMEDVVLTVRTIATVLNYDYIFDFIFHQNGAIEVKAISNGYILTSFRTPAEDDYGFRLGEYITGNIHHHMFHFKVDMDVKGTSNTFEILNIEPVQVDNSKWAKTPGSKYAQTKLVRETVQTERDAALKFNFDKPKYLTFHNNNSKTKYGLSRAYRLYMKGMSKQLFPEGMGQEPAISWARYQMAVTKYKEEEPRSSSMYTIWDGAEPVVNFQSFIDDNENIVDVDQVTWVTMGIHHIPHMEDIPVTPTVGLQLEFFLLPYNYFDEDPAISSRDAVRIDPRDPNDLKKGITINRYGQNDESKCMPQNTIVEFDKEISENPESVFDTA